MLHLTIQRLGKNFAKNLLRGQTFFGGFRIAAPAQTSTV